MTKQDYQNKLFTVEDLMDATGFGTKLEVGDTIIIQSISFDESMYGEVAIFETPEGRRFAGAVALVDFAKKLYEHQSFLPMTVRVTEDVSDSGRTYQVFR